MSQEQGPTPSTQAPFNVTVLERGETLLAFCNTCKRVVFKGGDRNRISRRVLESQIESHLAAFSQPHHIDILYTGL